jgi:hypothetical protein
MKIIISRGRKSGRHTRRNQGNGTGTGIAPDPMKFEGDYFAPFESRDSRRTTILS